MIAPRIATVLIAALVSFSGCGGCGRDDAGKPAAVAASTTMPAVSTTTARIAHGGQTYHLYRTRRWTVGEAVTRDATTVVTGRVTEVAPDGRQSHLPSTKQTVQGSWVEKTTDVDDDGLRRRYVVQMPTWVRTQADQRDESIQGVSLVVSGKGAGRTWSFAEHRREPTPEAREWLDGHFGARSLSDEQWLRITLADGDVAVGDSWNADTTLLAKDMAGTGLAIDPSDVTATVKLEAIDAGTARCSFDAKLGVLKIPNSDVALSSEGSMTFEGEMTIPLEPDPLVVSTLRLRAAFEGETTKDGTKTRYDFVADERSTTTPGGDAAEPSR